MSKIGVTSRMIRSSTSRLVRRQNVLLGHAGQLGHVGVRALRDREAALEQVEEPLVELVERDGGAVLSAPNLRYRLSHRATSLAW